MTVLGVFSEICIRGIGTASRQRRQPASEAPSESSVPGSAPPVQDKAALRSRPRADIRIVCWPWTTCRVK